MGNSLSPAPRCHCRPWWLLAGMLTLLVPLAVVLSGCQAAVNSGTLATKHWQFTWTPAEPRIGDHVSLQARRFDPEVSPDSGLADTTIQESGVPGAAWLTDPDGRPIPPDWTSTDGREEPRWQLLMTRPGAWNWNGQTLWKVPDALLPEGQGQVLTRPADQLLDGTWQEGQP